MRQTGVVGEIDLQIWIRNISLQSRDSKLAAITAFKKVALFDHAFIITCTMMSPFCCVPTIPRCTSAA